MRSQIIIENYEGINNTSERYQKWKDFGHYRDLSTIWVTPTRGVMGTRVAFNWMQIIGGFNQKLAKLCIEGFEVGRAYNEAIIQTLSNPILSKFKYLLTVEEDNTAPPDGLLKLYEAIDEYDAVGGLYWTKGAGGVPMIWGDPKEPGTYIPQAPIENTVQQCNGLGMGFTLFRMDMFKNPAFEFGKWFVTKGEKGEVMTQDLFFFRKAQELGYKFACHTGCKVGHYDHENGVIW